MKSFIRLWYKIAKNLDKLIRFIKYFVSTSFKEYLVGTIQAKIYIVLTGNIQSYDVISNFDDNNCKSRAQTTQVFSIK